MNVKPKAAPGRKCNVMSFNSCRRRAFPSLSDSVLWSWSPAGVE